MLKKILFYLVFSIVTAVLPSCSIFKKTGSVKENVSKENNGIPSKASLDNTSMLIDAKKEEIIGNYDNAVELYKKLIVRDPQNATGKYELANIYVLRKEYNNALSLLKDAVRIDPDNEWYQLQLAKTYEQNKQYDEAAAVYKRMIKQFPDNYEYYYSLATEYIIKGKYNDAIKVYNELEALTGINEDLSVQKKTLYLTMNKLDKAANEIQKLIDKYPSEVRYYFYKADIYIANKLPEKAYEIYKKILSIAPDDPHIHLSLAEYYRIKGNKQQSYKELEIAFSNPRLGITQKVTILYSYYVATESYKELMEQAYNLTEILIKTHPNEPKAYEIYGNFLARDKKYPEAQQQYHKVISLDSTLYGVWEQLLFMDEELKQFKLLKTESQKAIELFPMQPVPYMMNGDANIRLKDYNKAIESLKKGAELTVDNDDLLADFYSYLGDSYNEVKNYAASDSSYAKALEIKPDNENVLNNYAYYLCLRGENMKKAEDMAAKAVELSPDSPSYLDTYGWVLYKTGKLDKAREMIEKAIEKGGSDNDIILEHYGDIMYKTGYTDKALDYWKKAKQYGKGTELLDKKIGEGKLYE